MILQLLHCVLVSVWMPLPTRPRRYCDPASLVHNCLPSPIHLGIYQLLIFVGVNLSRELASLPTDRDGTSPTNESDLLRLIKTYCVGITRIPGTALGFSITYERSKRNGVKSKNLHPNHFFNKAIFTSFTTYP